MWAGYAGGGGAIVFQHSCPNNAPAILWARGGRFRPLFPNRGIPTELQGCFGKFDADARAEVLWTFKQYKLALSLVEDIREHRENISEWELAIALGLASSHGRWDDRKLQAQLMLPASGVENLRTQAYSLGMLDKQNHKLTAFAKDFLTWLKRHTAKKPKKAGKRLPTLEQLYYPDTCGGVAKL